MKAGPARTRLIEAGELVSNMPLRARCQWLMEHDPAFSLNRTCERLSDMGFNFQKRPRSGGRREFRGETTHLLRLLGLKDQAGSLKNGRRYTPPNRTAWVEYDLAVAIARALDMDPHEADV